MATVGGDLITIDPLTGRTLWHRESSSTSEEYKFWNQFEGDGRGGGQDEWEKGMLVKTSTTTTGKSGGQDFQTGKLFPDCTVGLFITT